MLFELYIENLAVISEASISFTGGFNVFTGETGAGKSILINGLNAVLGMRTNKEAVRSGCEKAVVTAQFKDIPEETVKKLEEYGFSGDGGMTVISREIFSDGGSAARINSRPAAISALREIGETLISVHGQHDGRFLLDADRHIEILDAFAGLECAREEYKASFISLQETARKLKNLTLSQIESRNEAARLEAVINEIQELEIEDGEDKAIEEEFGAAANGVMIKEALRSAGALISGADDTEGVTDMISAASYELSRCEEIMPPMAAFIERLENIRIEAADISSELERITGCIDIDPERYAYLSDRREKLGAIKRKYGPELEDVNARLAESLESLKKTVGASEEIKALEAKKEKLLKETSDKAKKLSDSRKKAAKDFTGRIAEELKFLDMPDVKTSFSHQTGKLGASGMDVMELLISVNAGEPPKPVAKIASGGELSRIMLAVKNITAAKDGVPTLIFDEIDSGVSGRAAQKIGMKLKQISELRQVICVTHLSQIAVKGDNHMLIEKESSAGKTFTSVKRLTGRDRVYEIARILHGGDITEAVLKDAEEQLKS